MSRRRESEIACGSDSFLDVIANIVGILIILIVIAGVRASKAPLKPASRSTGVELPQFPAKTTLPEATLPTSDESVAPEPIMADVPPAIEIDEPPEALPPLEAPAELVSRMQDLDAEIAAITVASKSVAQALETSNSLQTDLELRLQTTRSLIADRKEELTASVAKDTQQKLDLDLARQAVVRLLAKVNDAENQSPPTTKLEHRITPVSRVVHGRELHFRLERNRVAEVPIEALVERLKDHIERRKDWIVKTRQHKGQVGPINGFNLEYIIGVDIVSGVEELRAGMGGYRMSMRYWEIHPEESLRGEPDDVALSQGSKFYQALVSSSPDTTLTFWVYPDSYSLYRKLQAFCHEHGFPVAGRPLPEGVAISGSPNGTKSASQ